MNGRIYVLILFFWALLTIVTPMLIRLSASANLYPRLDGEQGEVPKVLLPRRALIQLILSPVSAPAPEPVLPSLKPGYIQGL
ncbi:uncharacterized protein LOC127246417 [Andrographis paniculata]|uniref:uncharacterized protein LOC127246417 n=1 Tax=Andrographis paniculata TaxID=175694 RepID=UPI0021E80B0D|nr:uncharacterized protein LOC127246417 [Andrographis paniculata]